MLFSSTLWKKEWNLIHIYMQLILTLSSLMVLLVRSFCVYFMLFSYIKLCDIAIRDYVKIPWLQNEMFTHKSYYAKHYRSPLSTMWIWSVKQWWIWLYIHSRRRHYHPYKCHHHHHHHSHHRCQNDLSITRISLLVLVLLSLTPPTTFTIYLHSDIVTVQLSSVHYETDLMKDTLNWI